MADGGLLWRQTVTGHDNAIRVLKALAVQTENEIFVMYVQTHSVVATMNVPSSQSASFNVLLIHSETVCFSFLAANSMASNSSGVTRTRKVPSWACPSGNGGRSAFLLS